MLVGKSIKVKTLSSVVGLLISFGLAVGRVARFFTRFSTMVVVKVVEAHSWGASMVMLVEVVK